MDSVKSENNAAGKAFLKAQFVSGRRYVFFSALAGVGSTLGTILEAYALASVIYLSVVQRVPLADLTAWFAIFALAAALKAVCSYLSARLCTEGALKIQRRLREKILDKLFLDDSAAFDPKTASSATALIEEVDRLESYYARYYPQLLLTVLSPLLMLGVIFPINAVVGFMLLLAAPIIPFYMALIGMGAEAKSRQQLAAVRHLSGYFLDRLQGLQTLKRLGYAGQETKNVAEASEDLGRRTMGVLRIAFLSSAVLEFFSTFAIAIVATYVGLVLLGYLSFGAGPSGMTLRVGFFLLLLAPAYFKPLRDFAATYHDRADALAAASSLAAAVTPPETSLPHTGRTTIRPPLSSIEAIELRGAEVRFGGRKQPALDRVSLEVSAGGRMAIVGPSGAGKSTLLGVIAGQVPLSRGELFVNGHDVRSFDPASLRALTSWIGQRPYLFPGTIAENIALGQPERSRQEIEAAAVKARVTGFATRLPAGLDTVLGERGAGLSGGEAQRVALARAFLKDAPLLLLDEPTAHLDAETEAGIIRTIDELSEGKTVLIATHSLALIELCERKLYLDGGVLKEPRYA